MLEMRKMEYSKMSDVIHCLGYMADPHQGQAVPWGSRRSVEKFQNTIHRSRVNKELPMAVTS